MWAVKTSGESTVRRSAFTVEWLFRMRKGTWRRRIFCPFKHCLGCKSISHTANIYLPRKLISVAIMMTLETIMATAKISIRAACVKASSVELLPCRWISTGCRCIVAPNKRELMYFIRTKNELPTINIFPMLTSHLVMTMTQSRKKSMFYCQLKLLRQRFRCSFIAIQWIRDRNSRTHLHWQQRMTGW